MRISDWSADVCSSDLRGADPAAAAPDDAWTALHYAAYEGHDRVAAALIAGGAPLEAREGDYGNTPLHLAARRLKRPVVALLLAAGAAIDARDRRDGNQALSDAAFDPLGPSVVPELLASGAANGRASCRDPVWPDVSSMGVAVSSNKK